MCKACYRARNAELQRERTKRDRARRLARGLTVNNTPRKEVHTPYGRFEMTMQALESQWALPYARWTPAHHAQHSALLRRLAGIDDAQQEVAA